MRRYTESTADGRDAGDEAAMTNERGVKVGLGRVALKKQSSQIGNHDQQCAANNRLLRGQ